MSDDATGPPGPGPKSPDPSGSGRSAAASPRSLTAVSRLPAQLYAARMRARERWRRLSVTVAVTLVVFAIVGYIIGWHTSVFGLTTVRVVGEKNVPARQIVAAAALGTGAPLASLDTAAAAARVEKLPQIATANVSVGWPHTAVISVTERVPAALIPNGSRYDVVDVSGVVFGSVTTPSAGLPVIQVQGDGSVKAAVVPGALAALKALAADVVHQITAISATSAYSISLKLRDGSVVNWGGADDASAKAADLAALLRLGKAARYDVSAPEAPAMSGQYD